LLIFQFKDRIMFFNFCLWLDLELIFEKKEIMMRTKQCMQCKAENTLKSKECWNCGAPFGLKGAIKMIKPLLVIAAIFAVIMLIGGK